jgi:hypothetical protein
MSNTKTTNKKAVKPALSASEAAKIRKAEYDREWRRLNPDRVKGYSEAFRDRQAAAAAEAEKAAKAKAKKTKNAKARKAFTDKVWRMLNPERVMAYRFA